MDTIQKYPMTTGGYDSLQDELKTLKSVERPAVIKAISIAREHGDLSENAEYHAARDQQSFCEGRIQEIESKLSFAQVIDITTIPFSGKVIFGSTVTIINIDTEATVTYKIVGDDEASVKLGKISYSSPIARGLIAKQEGDEVTIKTPAGEVTYEIETVQYI